MSFFNIWAEEHLARLYWRQESQRVAITLAESFSPSRSLQRNVSPLLRGRCSSEQLDTLSWFNCFHNTHRCYISMITKCARITVCQEVQASSKTCCMQSNFGLTQKGGQWLCHGTNAYCSPNSKINSFRLFFITEVNDILCEFQIESGPFSLELFVIHVNLKIKSFNGFYTLRPRYKLNASELAMPNQ